jgi:hypothetical protein
LPPWRRALYRRPRASAANFGRASSKPRVLDEVPGGLRAPDPRLPARALCPPLPTCVRHRAKGTSEPPPAPFPRAGVQRGTGVKRPRRAAVSGRHEPGRKSIAESPSADITRRRRGPSRDRGLLTSPGDDEVHRRLPPLASCCGWERESRGTRPRTRGKQSLRPFSAVVQLPATLRDAGAARLRGQPRPRDPFPRDGRLDTIRESARAASRPLPNGAPARRAAAPRPSHPAAT